jgi:hypothetical protein
MEVAQRFRNFEMEEPFEGAVGGCEERIARRRAETSIFRRGNS